MQNDPTHIPVAPESLKRKHESRSPALRNPVIVIGLVVVMTVVCFMIVSAMMSSFSRARPETTRPIGSIIAPDDKPLQSTPQPHLLVNEGAALQAFRQREEIELNTYGWINRTAGVARIPIDRAMELIAERGLPATNITAQSDLELIRERSQQR